MQQHCVLQSSLRNTQHVCQTCILGARRSPLLYPICFHPGAVPDGACTSINVNQQSCFTCARGECVRLLKPAALLHTGSASSSTLTVCAARRPQSPVPHPKSSILHSPVQSCLLVARVKHARVQKLERQTVPACNLSPGRTGARQTAS
jgi:hypothetical protein